MNLKIKLALIYFAAVVLTLAAFNAIADERIDRIEQAWNAGDPAATQQDFATSAFREAAELGSKVSGTLKVVKADRLNETAYGAVVEIDGISNIWVFEECADDPSRFCYFGQRQTEDTIMQAAEIGQAADVGTTAIAITGFGAAEANPLGLAFILPMKVGFLAHSRTLPFNNCVALRTSLDSFGLAGGVANGVAMAAALASAPITLGASVGILAAVSWARWDSALEAAVFDCAGFALG